MDNLSNKEIKVASCTEVIVSIGTLATIYGAGFNHGFNEGPFPDHGIIEAFHRLIRGESPCLDNVSYDIAHKIFIAEK